MHCTYTFTSLKNDLYISGAKKNLFPLESLITSTPFQLLKFGLVQSQTCLSSTTSIEKYVDI